MALATTWFVFPLLVGALSLGCGLLVERIGAVRLPGVLVVPVGLATIMVVSQALTYRGETAALTTPAVVALGVAGLAVGLPRLRSAQFDRWAALTALGVFAVCAAPFVFSGEATFGGYTMQGDIALHFISIDYVMEHGRQVRGLNPSTYEFLVGSYVGGSYPLGGQTALGALRPLVGQDVAWVFQPFLASIMVMTSLCLYAIVKPLIGSARLRAVVVFVAAQPALVYGYYQEGAIKELATILCLAAVIALIPTLLRQRSSVRNVIPLAIVAAAALSALGATVAPWLGPILLIALIAFVWKSEAPRTTMLAQLALFIVVVAALSVQVITTSADLLNAANGVLSQENQTGNLLPALRLKQALGIWLHGDFRILPVGDDERYTNVLIVLAAAAGVFGIVVAIRRRWRLLLVYLCTGVLGATFVIVRGSPWADAKALVIVSPVLVLTCLIGGASLFDRGRRLRGAVLMAPIVIGVLVSTALAYHDVNLAPRDRLLEQKKIGRRLAGQGPLLYPDFDEYVKHFVRAADPESPSEPHRFPPELRDGTVVPLGQSVDPDEFTLAYLLHYRTILLRRSPTASRPPSAFKNVYSGKYYEIWQRPLRADTRTVEHVPLGHGFQPSSTPGCAEVRRLARRAGSAGGRLAYVERSPSAVFVPALAKDAPHDWGIDRVGRTVYPPHRGAVSGTVRIERAGTYLLWLGGSFGRRTSVTIDGRAVGSVAYQLNGPAQYTLIATVQLARGDHRIAVSRGGGDLHPGNGGMLLRPIGAAVLDPVSAQTRTVRYLEPRRADALCHLDLDWIEVVRA